jgi:hypothetical protein
MTALSIQSPFPTITDIDGQPLEDGYIWIGAANLPPIGNPIAVYWDAALTQPAALPVRTRGGYPVNAGTPARLYVNSDYSIQVQNRNGSVVYSAPQATERYGGLIISSADISFLQAGSGAVVRTAQSKMRDVVSVKDFGAVGDGVADDTVAITNALAAAKRVYIPTGTYSVSQAVQVRDGQVLFGDGPYNSVITRTNTGSQTIDGKTVVAALYVKGSHNDVNNIQINAEITTLSGIYLNCNNSAFTNVRIVNNLRGLDSSTSETWMTTFRNVHAVNSAGTAFDFSGTEFKTSLTFDSCWAENVANAWVFSRAQYCTLNSCGADWANYTSSGNPYGTGYGNRASSLGVYSFNESCRVVMNGCGTENSYGNGIVSFGSGSNQVTINNIHTFAIKSEFVPDYTSYPNYAVGPIDTGLGRNSLVINGGLLDFSNTVVPVSHPAKPIATLVAFNYLQGTYGVQSEKMVFVSSTFAPAGTQFAGQGDTLRYCTFLWDQYNNPVITGLQTHDFQVTRSRSITGSGTVISIPFVSQGAQNRKHTLRVWGIDNTSNGNLSLAFSVNIGCASLTSVVNVTSGNLFGVTSVAASGLNVEITLPSSLTNPIICVEAVSERSTLIDLDNISIA